MARVGPRLVKVFLEERTLTLDFEKRLIEDENVSQRPGLFQANFLHLNHGKGVWTPLADLYALGLLLLVGTGLLMRRGPLGLAGRGKWLVGLGLLVPIAYLLWPR